ncbi:DUF6795 domain-containing protein [Marinimicrobium sp. ARAG 43.8]|uniref:DUF6795 domain-containing protein n=1 Tax=Marinimicrobium sp. ARAG 43.8 TaxID=3418719 RepID=UPI003CF7B577
MIQTRHIVLLILTGFFVLLLLMLPPQGVAMSLFPKKEVVLSSPMEGTVTFKGKPAVGAVLKRKVTWDGKDGHYHTVSTNQHGEFSLPKITGLWRPMSFSEFVVHQEIHVTFNGQKYLVWKMGKMDESLFGELGGRPVGLTCELTNEFQRVDVEHGLLGTVCTWDAVNN